MSEPSPDPPSSKGPVKSMDQIDNSVSEELKVVEVKLQNLTILETHNTSQISKKDQPKQQAANESTELSQTKYFVDINRTSIMFGKSTLFPGSIEQFDISIGLKDEIIEDNGSNPYMLRVIAKCNNIQFNDLDQYVFSVRSNERFQYFEQVRFKIRKKERAQVKVAVKIPPIRQSCAVEGFLEIQLQSLQPVCIPIFAKCQVPQIICIKELYKPEEDTPVIKIPAKKNQIRMPPIPFKNLSNFNFTLQIEAISNDSYADKPYDIITQSFVNCQANTQFFVNLQLKQSMSYKGQMPTKDYIRKILILKIKGSTIYYSYPIEIHVFESSNNSGMG